ncbi:MAG: hypothetical protein H7Y20_19355, partial [Bryobacteraceae bacterium]|nr:hypothetical protein [Bryobacteraceae bacterium]
MELGTGGKGTEGTQGTEVIEGQRQYVLLINSSQSQLTTADPSLTEAVQREDVPVVVDQTLVDQATELVRVKKLLTAPKWTLQKFAQTASAPASVNVADLTTVVSRDGTYRAQAVYTIKNRSRQFLALKLPPQSELLSVFVGNQPSRAVTTKRNGEAIQLIALPKTSAASLSFPVKVVWRGRLSGALPKSARVLREEFSFPAPEVISQQADPEYGIPVARTRWTVYLPDDLDAKPVTVASRHNLTLQSGIAPDLIYQKAAVQELGELLGIVEQNASGRTNYFALGNVKQLDQAVRSFSGATDAEFEQQKQQVLKRLSDLQQNVQIDEGRKTANYFAKDSRKSGESQSFEVQSGNTVNVQNLDSVEALAQNRDNNGRLFLSNTATGITVQADDGVNFNFGLQNQEADERKGEGKGDGKPSAGKPVTKGANLEQRQNLRSSNDSNLGDLNKVITDNNAFRQQAQGQQGQQGQQGVLYQQAFGGRSNRGGQQGQQGGFGGGGQQGGGQQGQFGQQGNSGLWMGNTIDFNTNGNLDFSRPAIGNTTNSNSSFGVNVIDAFNPSAAWGPAIPGTPIGLPGPPNLPYGEPTGLQSHTVRNRTSVSGAMPGGEGVPQLALPEPVRYLDTDMLTAQGGTAILGGTDNVLGANVNGHLAQRGMVNLGGVGLGQMPNAGGGGAAVWTQAGGLSLGFELPTTGQKLVFSKAGGDPKLALGLRPQESVRWGLNLVWTLVWLTVGLGVAIAMRSGTA